MHHTIYLSEFIFIRIYIYQNLYLSEFIFIRIYIY
jgi:hypothetical protein